MKRDSDEARSGDTAVSRRLYGPPRLEDTTRQEYLDRVAEACAKGAGWLRRPRAKKPVQRERGEQCVLAEWLDLTVGELGWLHVPNEGRGQARHGASERAQGLKPGAPDVLVFAPGSRCHDWKGVAIELKAPRKGQPNAGTHTPSVSAEQREWLDALTRHGWVCRVCYGADEAIRWLESLGYGRQR